MPSAEHETPIALVQLEPGLVAWLLEEFGDLVVPQYSSVRAQPTEVQITVPTTYHADGVLVFIDERDDPVLAVVVEVQRRWDRGKLRTWPMYLAQVEKDLDVAAALLVYCPSSTVARRYRREVIASSVSLQLRPFIVEAGEVPLVTDPSDAIQNPGAAVFGAIAHAGDQDVSAGFPALAAVLETVGPDRALSYYDIVLAGLPARMRSEWEDFMTATKPRYYSEKFQRLHADGVAEGVTSGRAHDVLVVLAARGVAVPDEAREQILSGTDPDVLEDWLRRAVTAATVDEVIAEQ